MATLIWQTVVPLPNAVVAAVDPQSKEDDDEVKALLVLRRKICATANMKPPKKSKSKKLGPRDTEITPGAPYPYGEINGEKGVTNGEYPNPIPGEIVTLGRDIYPDVYPREYPPP
jgi:hypothetical protein